MNVDCINSFLLQLARCFFKWFKSQFTFSACMWTGRPFSAIQAMYLLDRTWILGTWSGGSSYSTTVMLPVQHRVSYHCPAHRMSPHQQSKNANLDMTEIIQTVKTASEFLYLSAYSAPCTACTVPECNQRLAREGISL